MNFVETCDFFPRNSAGARTQADNPLTQALDSFKDKQNMLIIFFYHRFIYRTRAIITRGLYIFYSLFEVQKRTVYKTVFQHFRKFSNKTNGPVMRIAGAKAELPQVFFFSLNFLPWEFLLIKKLEIEKTKTTLYTTFKTDFQLFY